MPTCYPGWSCHRHDSRSQSAQLRRVLEVSTEAEDARDLQIAPMVKGMQNHVRVLKSLKAWHANKAPNITRLTTAAPLEGV